LKEIQLFHISWLSSVLSIIIEGFSQAKPDKQVREIREEQIDKSRAWAYFNGASQGNPHVGGAEGLHFLRDGHVLEFKAGLGRGTNNLAEFMALKLLIMLVAEKDVHNIQFFGDSLDVINWMNGSCELNNYVLRPIFHDIRLVCPSFDEISFVHIYWERNMEADASSNAGPRGVAHAGELEDGALSEFFHDIIRTLVGSVFFLFVLFLYWRDMEHLILYVI
jgi:ribonuclease HI